MSAPDPRARLRAVLDGLLRKLTRRTWANARQMQVDAGAAMALLREVSIPNGEHVAMQLGALLRELGRPRPDLSRYVLTVEEAIGAIDRGEARAREEEKEDAGEERADAPGDGPAA